MNPSSGPSNFGPRGPSFTQSQLRALHNVPRATGALSLVGSCLIIYMILKSSQHKLGRTQNRLLFAISVTDLPFSLMFVLGTILMPADLPFEGTYGTQATCTFQGFSIQLGYAQPLYNAFLMVFYALNVTWGLRQETISRRIEPFFHGTAILFALGTAIAGIPLKIFNPTPVGRCSINSFPLGCITNPRVDCQRGENHEVYKWAFNLVPTMLALVVQFGALFFVCHSVLAREHENRRKYDRRGSLTSLSSTMYSRRVGLRALGYAVIFFNTYAWITIANMRRLISNVPPKYWIVVLGNTLQPFQGFFNLFMYLEPRYSAVRKCHVEWRWYRVAWYAIQHGTGDLPDPSTRSLQRGESRHLPMQLAEMMDSSRKTEYSSKHTGGTEISQGTPMDDMEPIDDDDDDMDITRVGMQTQTKRRVSISNPESTTELTGDTNFETSARRYSLPLEMEIQDLDDL